MEVMCALPAVAYEVFIRPTDICSADGTRGQSLTTGNGGKTGIFRMVP